MNEKKIVKLAVIREDGERSCPFGLPIPDACCNVGSQIDNMVATNEMQNPSKKDTTKKSNNRIFMFSRESGEAFTGSIEDCKAKCKFANKMFENGKVECSFGDYAAGLGDFSVNPGPMLNTYLGVGYNSQYYTVPFNVDFDGSNRFYFAKEDNKDMEKTAKEDKDDIE